MHDVPEPDSNFDIAVIGMTGRFPGARGVDEFCENLRNGVESIATLEDQQLESFGIPPSVYKHPNYVKAAPMLTDVDRFDASFFGYSPSEAEMMDPQQRTFLECAWEAVESAGYRPDAYPGLVGVFAGTSMSSYLLYNLLPILSGPHADNALQVMIGNDKDFLSTRVSYKLNLHGPSMTIQSACSTSLVATHLACQALQNYQCDLALAGGVSIQVPARTGYICQDEGLQSPDGHCRAFDHKGQGTLFGSGVGIVVLKRLSDALADRDFIHAVIKGTAVNNDGNRKVGFTAPSVSGQTEVIKAAMAFGKIDPRSIEYVECHGTATPLGDPVEILALANAFRADAEPHKHCAIGSVKTNIGHLDAAAGVAGLIKAIVALRDKFLPPSLHFETPNPKIDFGNSPFYVNTRLSDWKAKGDSRRACVSSFGIGGTNAHIVLEEPPIRPHSGPSRDWKLLVLSGKSKPALDQQTINLLRFCESHAELNVADVAYTTQTGRSVFEFRRAILCRGREDLIGSLKSLDGQRVFTSCRKQAERFVTFMFPGGGAQHVNMGADLYRTEPAYRKAFDDCNEVLKHSVDIDLRSQVFANDESSPTASALMKQASVALPALFVTEYSMAQLLMSWGITPRALIGHSLGEYVAACIAGVFCLEDALSLVLTRSRLVQNLPSGAMLSVPLSTQEVQPLLTEGLSLAAVNGASQCVVSGAVGLIDDVVKELEAREIEYRRVQINGAGHCDLVSPILPRFLQFLQTIRMHSPRIPFISNVTGTWVTSDQAVDPQYWISHFRHTVRFSDGFIELLKSGNRVFIEVGPGHTLTNLGKAMVTAQEGAVLANSMRHPYDKQSDLAVLLTAVGKLWLAGVTPDWQRFYAGEQRQRQVLPTYPFERKRYWIQPKPGAVPTNQAEHLTKRAELETWFYLPSWKRSSPPAIGDLAAERVNSCWLIFTDELGLGASLAKRLGAQSEDIVTVSMGERFSQIQENAYELDFCDHNDYVLLFQSLKESGKRPANVVHLWNITGEIGDDPSSDDLRKMLQSGFYSVLFVSQALAHLDSSKPVDLWVVTDYALQVESDDLLVAEKAALLGICKVLSQECDGVRCHFLDAKVPSQRLGVDSRLVNDLIGEMTGRGTAPIVALRKTLRWLPAYEPCPLAPAPHPTVQLRDQGVYLLTGGIGSIGLSIAEHFARTVHARLVLTTRSHFPPREAWDCWLADHGDADSVSRTIARLMDFEKQGSEVAVFAADAGDELQMLALIENVRQRFGAIHGVIHLAGKAGEGAIELIPQITFQDSDSHFRAKMIGTRVLERVIRGQDLDFVLLFSSNATVLGGVGLANYTAANLALDTFAQNARCRPTRTTRWISVNWDGWLSSKEKLSGGFQTSLDSFGMTTAEGVEALQRILASQLDGQIVVSTAPLDSRVRLLTRDSAMDDQSDSWTAESHDRPELETAYVAPRNELEQTIARIWQELLRVEKVGIGDNFFDLGGSSLIALKVIARLRKEVKARLPLVSIFEGPTVAALAQLISKPATEIDVFEESRDRGASRREQVQIATGGNSVSEILA